MCRFLIFINSFRILFAMCGDVSPSFFFYLFSFVLVCLRRSTIYSFIECVSIVIACRRCHSQVSLHTIHLDVLLLNIYTHTIYNNSQLLFCTCIELLWNYNAHTQTTNIYIYINHHFAAKKKVEEMLFNQSREEIHTQTYKWKRAPNKIGETSRIYEWESESIHNLTLSLNKFNVEKGKQENAVQTSNEAHSRSERERWRGERRERKMNAYRYNPQKWNSLNQNPIEMCWNCHTKVFTHFECETFCETEIEEKSTVNERTKINTYN